MSGLAHSAAFVVENEVWGAEAAGSWFLENVLAKEGSFVESMTDGLPGHNSTYSYFYYELEAEATEAEESIDYRLIPNLR